MRWQRRHGRSPGGMFPASRPCPDPHPPPCLCVTAARRLICCGCWRCRHRPQVRMGQHGPKVRCGQLLGHTPTVGPSLGLVAPGLPAHHTTPGQERGGEGSLEAGTMEQERQATTGEWRCCCCCSCCRGRGAAGPRVTLALRPWRPPPPPSHACWMACPAPAGWHDPRLLPGLLDRPAGTAHLPCPSHPALPCLQATPPCSSLARPAPSCPAGCVCPGCC